MSDTALNTAVIKSDLPWQLAPSGAGLGNELIWPLSPIGLMSLYLNNSIHCRAVHVKAAGAFGAGITFDTDREATRFDALLSTGASDLFEDLAIDLATFGNAFIETTRNSRGQLRGIRRLPAIHMIRLAGNRAAQVVYDDRNNQVVTRFEEGEWMQVRVACPGGHWYAYPDWIGGHGMLELVESAIEYNRRFFSNRALPEYAIITKGFALSSDQKAAVRSFFAGEFGGLDRSHRTLYMHLPDEGHSIDFKQITASQKDADFLKLMESARDDLPIAHGVPPRMLGIMAAGALGGGGEVTGQLHVFEELTLAPLRRRMATQFRLVWRELGIPPEHVAFNGIDLTPPDNQGLDPAAAAWVATGLLTIDEARDLAGLTKRADAGPALARLLGRL